jgi:hypothetical protein
VQRTYRRALNRERPENIAAQRPTGMQNNFPLPSVGAEIFLPALRSPPNNNRILRRSDSRKGFGRFSDDAIGRDDQDQIGRKHGFRETRLRLTSTDAPRGRASGAHEARNHRPNAPAFLV